jgi:hypothetical protein
MWYTKSPETDRKYLLGMGFGDLGATRRETRDIRRAAEQARKEQARLQKQCRQQRGTWTNVAAAGAVRPQYECRMPVVTTPVSDDGTVEPSVAALPGLTKLAKRKLNQLIQDARKECKRKGGHLVIQSLMPLKYDCQFFTPQAAPVTPTPVVTQPPGSYTYPSGGGTTYPTYPTYGGGGSPSIQPIDQYGASSGAGGGYGYGATPAPYTAPGAAPGGVSTGGALFIEEDPGLMPEESFQMDMPISQAPGFPPSAMGPSEGMRDECSIGQPFDHVDEFGPMRVLAVFCGASAPAAAAPAASGVPVGPFGTLPQGYIEQSDIMADGGPLMGLGRWIG